MAQRKPGAERLIIRYVAVGFQEYDGMLNRYRPAIEYGAAGGAPHCPKISYEDYAETEQEALETAQYHREKYHTSMVDKVKKVRLQRNAEGKLEPYKLTPEEKEARAVAKAMKRRKLKPGKSGFDRSI